MSGRRGRVRVSGWLALVAVLWLLGAGVVAAGALADWRGRASSPEAALRAYLTAVTDEDADRALAEILPTARPAAAPFIAEQLGNGYRVLGVGVQQESLLDRLLGRGAADRALITVQLDISLFSGETWRTTTTVPAVRTADGWFLTYPPLQPQPAGAG
ncbi:MAG TPA: hypothetical protein VK066_08795 [Chloroflexota bacterium]|nr:hypothetical protein [Chloroflexota bacterium]